MALGSHLITVRRLEKYINDVIGKKANLPDTSKTIIGNISQINSNKQNKTDNALTTTAKSIVGAINEINSDLTNNTCANLLNPTKSTQTINGVTCTNNGDGTYTLNGTASNVIYFTLKRDFNISAGTYKLNCCVSPSYSEKYCYLQTSDNTTIIMDEVVGIATIPDSSDCKFVLYIASGQTLTNEVIKPMLTTDLNAKYSDYVPYTGDSGRLNEDVAQINSELTDINNVFNTNGLWRMKCLTQEFQVQFNSSIQALEFFFTLTDTNILLLQFRDTTITYLVSEDGGRTWRTYWTK